MRPRFQTFSQERDHFVLKIVVEVGESENGIN